jgi:hypothetical protein
MTRIPFARFIALTVSMTVNLLASAATPPSIPPVDAPELAALGSAQVGVRTLNLIDRQQYDVLATDKTTGVAPVHDRALVVDVWYPANPPAHAQAETYVDALPSEPPAPRRALRSPALPCATHRPSGDAIRW